MNKRSLEEKIKNTVFWLSYACVVYLVIGFLFETAWLSKPYSLKCAFSLIKDALLVTAAFLAPVAAFVLFSDWREQHNAVKKDTFFDKVLRNATQIKQDLTKEKNNAFANITLGLSVRTDEERVNSLSNIRNSIDVFSLRLESSGVNDNTAYMELLKAYKSALDDVITQLLFYKSVDEINKALCVVDVLHSMLIESRPTI